MKIYLILPLMFFIYNFSYSMEKNYTIKAGVPKEISSQIVLVEVDYTSFTGEDSLGLLAVNRSIANEIIEIFREIKKTGFQIEKIVPISEYGWDDNKSMEDNNTSAYNYRFIENTTKLSNHSYGMAIDINPKYNPMIIKNKTYPTNGEYSEKNIGTINKNSELVKIFKKRGWKWGGDYKSLKDFQHFEKIIK